MHAIRLVPRQQVVTEACSGCRRSRQRWDRIAGKPYCPNCEEELILGIAESLCERTERKACVICSRLGTVRYLTFPLGATPPLEMDLCPKHLRGLLARSLKQYPFRELQRKLRCVGLEVKQVFLLHDAFYDADGYALQPAIEVE
jgi:hypothetical protein